MIPFADQTYQCGACGQDVRADVVCPRCCRRTADAVRRAAFERARDEAQSFLTAIAQPPRHPRGEARTMDVLLAQLDALRVEVAALRAQAGQEGCPACPSGLCPEYVVLNGTRHLACRMHRWVMVIP